MLVLKAGAELAEPGVLASGGAQDEVPSRWERVCGVLKEERAWRILGSGERPASGAVSKGVSGGVGLKEEASPTMRGFYRKQDIIGSIVGTIGGFKQGRDVT